MFKNPAGIDPRNVGVSWQRTEWSKTPGRPNLEKIFMQKWGRQLGRVCEYGQEKSQTTRFSIIRGMPLPEDESGFKAEENVIKI